MENARSSFIRKNEAGAMRDMLTVESSLSTQNNANTSETLGTTTKEKRDKYLIASSESSSSSSSETDDAGWSVIRNKTRNKQYPASPPVETLNPYDALRTEPADNEAKAHEEFQSIIKEIYRLKLAVHKTSYDEYNSALLTELNTLCDSISIWIQQSNHDDRKAVSYYLDKSLLGPIAKFKSIKFAEIENSILKSLNINKNEFNSIIDKAQSKLGLSLPHFDEAPPSSNSRKGVCSLASNYLKPAAKYIVSNAFYVTIPFAVSYIIEGNLRHMLAPESGNSFPSSYDSAFTSDMSSLEESTDIAHPITMVLTQAVSYCVAHKIVETVAPRDLMNRLLSLDAFTAQKSMSKKMAMGAHLYAAILDTITYGASFVSGVKAFDAAGDEPLVGSARRCASYFAGALMFVAADYVFKRALSSNGHVWNRNTHDEKFNAVIRDILGKVKEKLVDLKSNGILNKLRDARSSIEKEKVTKSLLHEATVILAYSAANISVTAIDEEAISGWDDALFTFLAVSIINGVWYGALAIPAFREAVKNDREIQGAIEAIQKKYFFDKISDGTVTINNIRNTIEKLEVARGDAYSQGVYEELDDEAIEAKLKAIVGSLGGGNVELEEEEGNFINLPVEETDIRHRALDKSRDNDDEDLDLELGDEKPKNV